MSAREELFSLASRDMPVSGAEVDEAIDAFAHELAEEAREAARDEGGSYEWQGGVDWAADLIDPMKEGDRG